MTAPKRGGMSEIPHPHAAHLPLLPNHDSDCDRFACQFLVRSFLLGVSFQFGIITLWVG